MKLFADAPVIDRRPEFTKLAFPRGAPAFLTCRASGVPEVEFTWYLKRKADDPMEKIGHRHRDRGEHLMEPEALHGPQFLASTYDSILEIDNVRSEHYNTFFRCDAANKFGVASHNIKVFWRFSTIFVQLKLSCMVTLCLKIKQNDAFLVFQFWRFSTIFVQFKIDLSGNTASTVFENCKKCRI